MNKRKPNRNATRDSWILCRGRSGLGESALGAQRGSYRAPIWCLTARTEALVMRR